MYSIIGSDDLEYGPVEVEVLVRWARDGRIVERTQIIDHTSGRRYLACDMAELSRVFAAKEAGTLAQPPPAVAPPQMPTPAYVTVPEHMLVPRPRRSRAMAGLLGITVGCLGIHRYYLGYTGTGTVMLVLSLTGCGLAITIPWALVEGIIVLAGGMRDADGAPLT